MSRVVLEEKRRVQTVGGERDRNFEAILEFFKVFLLILCCSEAFFFSLISSGHNLSDTIWSVTEM